jgi:hypothetical protein
MAATYMTAVLLAPSGNLSVLPVEKLLNVAECTTLLHVGHTNGHGFGTGSPINAMARGLSSPRKSDSTRKAMGEKTIVLRKGEQWYVITSHQGDEREILLTLLEYAEQRKYDIQRSEVLQLIDRLGWKLEVHSAAAR